VITRGAFKDASNNEHTTRVENLASFDTSDGDRFLLAKQDLAQHSQGSLRLVLARWDDISLSLSRACICYLAESIDRIIQLISEVDTVKVLHDRLLLLSKSLRLFCTIRHVEMVLIWS